MKDKTVKNTHYKIVGENKGLLTVKARIGANGVEVIFDCLEIEWNNDFVWVQQRLKDIVLDCTNAI